MIRRNFLGTIGAILGLPTVKAVAVADSKRALIIVQPNESYGDLTAEDVARFHAQWDARFKGAGPQLVILSHGLDFKVVAPEGCMVSETLGDYSYEVHGRTPEEVQGLLKLK